MLRKFPRGRSKYRRFRFHPSGKRPVPCSRAQIPQWRRRGCVPGRQRKLPRPDPRPRAKAWTAKGTDLLPHFPVRAPFRLRLPRREPFLPGPFRACRPSFRRLRGEACRERPGRKLPQPGRLHFPHLRMFRRFRRERRPRFLRQGRLSSERIPLSRRGRADPGRANGDSTGCGFPRRPFLRRRRPCGGWRKGSRDFAPKRICRTR